MLKHVKLLTKAGEIDLPNLEEYVVGFQYFYARIKGGETVSISRKVIVEGLRETPNGMFKPIGFKKPPKGKR